MLLERLRTSIFRAENPVRAVNATSLLRDLVPHVELTIRRRANCYPRDDEEAKQTPLNQAVGGDLRIYRKVTASASTSSGPCVTLSKKEDCGGNRQRLFHQEASTVAVER